MNRYSLFTTMKIATALVSAALVSSVYGGRLEASVYTFGANSSPSTTDNVTPSTARVLLAHRLGLSQFHSLEVEDDLTLAILNRFSDSQSSLFASGDKDEKVHRLLVIVEGVEDPKRAPPIYGFFYSTRNTNDHHRIICSGSDLYNMQSTYTRSKSTTVERLLNPR